MRYAVLLALTGEPVIVIGNPECVPAKGFSVLLKQFEHFCIKLNALLLLCGILVLLCRNVVVIEPVVLEENRCESLYAAVNLSGKGCGVRKPP